MKLIEVQRRSVCRVSRSRQAETRVVPWVAAVAEEAVQATTELFRSWHCFAELDVAVFVSGSPNTVPVLSALFAVCQDNRAS